LAALTHVCMWSEKGWKRITAEEASRIYPYGTSAHSGLFMCELCGQYVTLTHGTVQSDHFRHNPGDKSKTCPERSRVSASSYNYNSKDHDLPIKIKVTSGIRFELMMGFIQIPSRLLVKDLRINILDGKGKNLKAYAKERLQADGITYLSIGNKPCEKYQIDINGASQDIYDYWPKVTNGIDPDGTIFDKESGKRLIYDADIVVGKTYYLLVRNEQFFYGAKSSHVYIRKICNMTIPWEQWVVYEVMAKDFHESSAKFFLKYHYRLTDTPVSFQTVWPIFIEDPYIIRFNGNKVYAFLKGYAPTTHTFPSAYIKKYYGVYGNILEIESNTRQQLVSAGRTTALEYTYLWKVPLTNITEEQSIDVEDLKGMPLGSGTYTELPYEKSLKILLPYDGQIVLKTGGYINEKISVEANSSTIIDNISWNISIYIYIGFDCVWKADFIRKRAETVVNESEILKQLQSFSGPVMRIPHTIGGIASSLEQYPLIRKWILKCIRSGRMNEKAFRYLQKAEFDKLK